jgi:hypothetical protein
MSTLVANCFDFLHPRKAPTFSCLFYAYPDTLEHIYHDESSRHQGHSICTFLVASPQQRIELHKAVILHFHYRNLSIISLSMHIPRPDCQNAFAAISPLSNFSLMFEEYNDYFTEYAGLLHEALSQTTLTQMSNAPISDITTACLPSNNDIHRRISNTLMTYHDNSDFQLARRTASLQINPCTTNQENAAHTGPKLDLATESLTCHSDPCVYGPVLGRLYDYPEWFHEDLGFTTFSSLRTAFELHLRSYRTEGSRTFPYTSDDHTHADCHYLKDPETITPRHFFQPLLKLHRWQDIEQFKRRQPHSCWMLKRCPLDEFITFKNSITKIRIPTQTDVRKYLFLLAEDNFNHLYPEQALLSRIELSRYLNDHTLAINLIYSAQTPPFPNEMEISTPQTLPLTASLVERRHRQITRSSAMDASIQELSTRERTLYESTETDQTTEPFRSILKKVLTKSNNKLEPQYHYDLSDFGF